MGEILARLGNGAEHSEREIESNLIKLRIKRKREDLEKGIMIICGGDVVQSSALKNGSIFDYLIKLDNFVESLPKELK